ncbi:BON domain-containing protein [Actinoplanes sp. NPDC051633]|uniref:BON domain-containing protein n=1 Tax=Actinoplanes sp. NPDC051633 TaxID=3155670 RepID=UPI00342F9107
MNPNGSHADPWPLGNGGKRPGAHPSIHPAARHLEPVVTDQAPAESTEWIADEVVDADRFLADLITAGIRNDPGVRAGRIWVTVQNAVIILEGYVVNHETRDAALRTARAIPGVFDVCDRLGIEADNEGSWTPNNHEERRDHGL